MVFKLVRTDTEEPCKILLPIGTHLIGRGQFLDCDDNRVSRQHGELQVTWDTITMKSLHQNPCFYTKEGTEEIQVLKQGYTITLCHGDKFGLLPNSFWFELMHCALLDDVDSPTSESSQYMEETITATEPYKNRKDQNGMDSATDDEELANVDIHEAITQRCGSPSLTTVKSEIESPKNNVKSCLTLNNAGSPSIIPNNAGVFSTSENNVGSPSITQNETPPDLRTDSPSLLCSVNLASTESLVSVNNLSPTKRCHSPASKYDAKKIKLEPQDVKQEPDPQPGPSGDQGDAPGSSDNNKANPGASTSPVKPNPPFRERCICGANLQDVKQELDPQPGPSGEQGIAPGSSDNNKANPGASTSPVQPNPPCRERCYYGAKCYRKNPAHKAQFSHPNDPDWGAGEQGVCPYGRTCMRWDLRHWRDHTHPPGTLPPPPNGGNNWRVRQNKPMQKKTKHSQSTQESDDDSLPTDLIVTGKRARKTIQSQSWSGSDLDEDNEDPYQTDDDEDDWVPSTQSQDTQDD